MKKVTRKIRSGNDELIVEVLYRKNDTDAGYVKITCDDFEELSKIRKEISKKYMHLLPESTPPIGCNEFVCKDKNYTHVNFGIDKKEEFNLDNAKTNLSELYRFVTTYLGGPK